MDQNRTAAGGLDTVMRRSGIAKKGFYLFLIYKCTIFIVKTCLSLLLECNMEENVSTSYIVHALVKEKQNR